MKILKNIVKAISLCIILISTISFSDASNKIYKLSAEGKVLEVQINEQEEDHGYYNRNRLYTTTPRDTSLTNDNERHSNQYINDIFPLRTLTTRNTYRSFTHTEKQKILVDVKSEGEEPEINFNYYETDSIPWLDSNFFTQEEHSSLEGVSSIILPIGAISTGKYILSPILTLPEVKSRTDRKAILIGSLRYGFNSNNLSSSSMFVNVDIELMEDGTVRVNRIFTETIHQRDNIRFIELSFIRNEDESNSELSPDQMTPSYQDDEDDNKLAEATGTASTPDPLTDSVELQLNPASINILFSNP